ncbi:glycosyltransferase family 4 protein [Chloroflexota bacterium]
MRIAVVNPIMTTVTTGGPLSASRITSITPPRTDEDNMMVELAKCIAVLGHEVTVFASDFYRPLHSVSDTIPGVRVVYLPTKLRSVFHPAYIPFIPHLYTRIREGQYTIVQSTEFLQWGTILTALASSQKFTRLVIWHELSIKQRFPGNLAQSVYANTLGRIIANKAAMFVPRSWAARDYLVSTGIASAKIGQVIHSGVSTDVFFPVNAKDTLKQQLGLDPHCFVILSVGRLVPYKGHRYLILALSKILERHPNTRLLIIGDGPEKVELCELIKSLGIERSAALIAPVTKCELAKYYNAADVMALPSSEKELFPNFTILESLTCGTPVIFSKLGGDRELGDSHCGYYVGFGDAEQLSEAILKLIENPQRQIDMSRAAVDLVRSEYDMRVIARKWVEVYQTVVA